MYYNFSKKFLLCVTHLPTKHRNTEKERYLNLEKTQFRTFASPLKKLTRQQPKDPRVPWVGGFPSLSNRYRTKFDVISPI